MKNLSSHKLNNWENIEHEAYQLKDRPWTCRAISLWNISSDKNLVKFPSASLSTETFCQQGSRFQENVFNETVLKQRQFANPLSQRKIETVSYWKTDVDYKQS